LETFLQLLISGIATGAVYALAAVGFALLWQTSGAINFAQGEFVSAAALVMYAAMALLGVGPLIAFVIALPISLLLFGVVFKKALVEPLLKRGEFALVIATLGLSIFIREVSRILAGAEPLQFPNLAGDEVLRVGSIVIAVNDVATIAIAATIIFGLQWFLNRTFIGRSMEATAQNTEVARILGIDVDRMILYAFLLNAALITLGALLITPKYQAKFSNGEVFGLVAFMAAIVGGFNQVRGALFGGFLIGILDNLAAYYVSTTYRSAFPILLLVIVILFKPEGLFGRKEERKI
jgi:branched-chain amino acid transport system permease protein